MPPASFDRSVFINCPFDADYTPILNAMLFCVLDLGFRPRLALERTDSGEGRLDKIRELIESSRYSIHDLSRCQAATAGEIYRLNMPFELGLDYGCRRYLDGRRQKKILILEEQRFRYQAALSDLAGFDIESHDGDFEKVVRKVRNWLVSEAGAPPHAPARILTRYLDFQRWHYKSRLAAGFSEDDIRDYPTREFLDSIDRWIAAGEPPEPDPPAALHPARDRHGTGGAGGDEADPQA